MKKIFLLAAATLALAACDNNENPSVAAKITATIGDSRVSRASDSSWAPGDEIGISSTVGDIAGPYTNVKYTTPDGTGIFEGTPLYFYKPMVLKAYYPFTGTQNEVPGTRTPGVIEASTTSDMQADENRPDIDFLFASVTDIVASKPEVNFNFTHKMSKITLAFKGTEEVNEDGVFIPGVNVSDMIAYEIEGLVLDGTFDTATGLCAIDEDAEEGKIRIELDKGSVKEGEYLSPLIVFPQQPGNSKIKLHVYCDELDDLSAQQHYICTLTFGNGELKPGNSYNYTVQITKVGLILEEMKIDNWNTEREVNVTATIDGGWKPGEQQQ